MAKLISVNPSDNYKKIGSVKISSLSEVKQAVKRARKASLTWGNLSVKDRVVYLKDVYDKLYKRRKEISILASTEMGFPIRDQKLFDMGDGFDYFKWYLKTGEKILADEITFKNKNEIHKIVYEPYGVAAVIQPWNFPFCQWSWAVIPNLIAGNTVVFKHAEECPLSGKLIEDIIKESKLPVGVFNEVYGDGKVGAFLVDQDIDLIAFTGSYSVGQQIYNKAAKKFIKVVLELGGSAPGIVFKDADIDSTIENVVGLRFLNSGQACDGLKRLIVHNSIFDKVVKGLKDKIESMNIGMAVNKNTDIGPLVSEKQLILVEKQYLDAKRKGAKTITGGKRPENLKGAYFMPTLITNISSNMRVWKEEVFGPVLPIVSFKDDDEALKLANDTEFGLGGYVFTSNLTKAEKVARQMKTGNISVNGTNYVCPFNPFGGYKHSGIGREHGSFGLQDLCQIKVIAKNK